MARSSSTTALQTSVMTCRNQALRLSAAAIRLSTFSLSDDAHPAAGVLARKLVSIDGQIWQTCSPRLWDENSRKADFGTVGPRKMNSGQEAMTTFLKKPNIINIDRNWTNIRLCGLRIKPFQTSRCHESNRSPPDPPNCHTSFKIDQKSNGLRRQKCTLLSLIHI